ncbi:MAG TPA: ATP-dependent DNA ligase [Burkholderiaceae bacterium]|nr:ATP-dependent DNA ligase [Burkholderiaceae bacterium]
MGSFAQVVAASARVAQSSARSRKIAELASCLRALDPDEVELAIGYLSGSPRQGRLGVSHATLHAVRAPPSQSATLRLRDVDSALDEIASVAGKGASARRADALQRLLAAATAEEQDFLARLLTGELRQGALHGVMLDAVAAAANVAPDALRRAAMCAGGLPEVAAAALADGEAGLQRYVVRPMQPVLPMLAQSADSPQQALERFGRAAFEWKLDGARVQVHKAEGDVRVFTRNLNDVTERVPELVDSIRPSPQRTMIVDGEVIALRADGTPLPFQQTMRRFGRRLDVAAMREQLALSAFFFDCLYADGEVLVERPARERFEALERCVAPDMIVRRIVTGDAGTASAFAEQAVAAGHEGVVAKSLDARYEAGRRGAGWLKVKRANTLDLVVLAAERGHGRRSRWLSNLHLGARDPVGGGFVMLGKTFKGLTDEMLAWQTARFRELAVRDDGWTVHLRPELVVEIAFNEIQASSQYPGGVALRFARVKGYRPDKRAGEADTIDTVLRLHRAQVQAAG